MSTPATLASIGAQRPGAKYPGLALTREHDRFADVRAIRLGRMPQVKPGQVWADNDPRSTGRTVRVLAVRADGKAVVETVTPRRVPPRTPSRVTRDTVGSITVVAVRRFRPGSRGFTLVQAAPKGKKKRSRSAAVRTAGLRPASAAPGCGTSPAPGVDQVESLAGVLAAGNPVLPLDYRAAAALHGLLGSQHVETFLASTANGHTPVRRYNDHGVGVLMIAAVDWATAQGLVQDWMQTPGA